MATLIGTASLSRRSSGKGKRGGSAVKAIRRTNHTAGSPGATGTLVKSTPGQTKGK